VADALRRLPGSAGERFATIFEHGTLQIEMYAPRGADPQTPHARDEVYVIVRGHGTFFDGEARRAVSVGDLLFVRAGIEHRFEDFSDDFATWVMFYGPEGGEASF
jgi:mannose-6-phosphate isomerase-like protein (cupin superfamily)